MDKDPLSRYELVFLLGLSFQRLIDELVGRLDAAGYGDLRPVHGFALQIIAASEATTASDLGKRLGVTKQASAQMVDYLLERGYVARGDHPLGGRRRRIVLTDRGERHLREAGAILHELERGALAGIPAARQQVLRSDLVALIRQRIEAPAVPPLRPVW